MTGVVANDTQAFLDAFDAQIRWCTKMGSPMYTELVSAARNDMARDGPTRAVVEGFPLDPTRAAVALRFLGGIHRLVLDGRAPDLARFYPTVGGTPSQGMVDAFIETVAHHCAELRAGLDVAPQTNDIGRSAALLPALSYALGGRKMPVILLEIGSSAGLNLLLDKYRYEFGDRSWGDPDASAIVRSDWSGDPPDLFDEVTIVERRGCDLMPLDVTDPVDRLRVLSFVWADQTERFKRLQAAIDIATQDPPPLDAADAAHWTVERLEEPHSEGTMVVLQHSIMWQYLSEEAGRAVADAIEKAGRRATQDRPFAHIGYEPAPEHYEARGHQLMVTTWPGGHSTMIATGHAHGSWIEWSA